MKLYERLPETVTVGGRTYKCDFDFRNVLKMLEIMNRKDIIPDARDYLCIKCVISHKIPSKIVSSVYNELCTVLFPKPEKQPENGEKQPRIMSYEKDAGLIRAAFRQVYGIDLFRAKLHWFEFTELLQNLPDGNRFEEVISIRSRPLPPPNKYNMEQRAWLIKAKRSVALEVTEEEAAENYSRGVRNLFHMLLNLAKKDGEDVDK